MGMHHHQQCRCEPGAARGRWAREPFGITGPAGTGPV